MEAISHRLPDSASTRTLLRRGLVIWSLSRAMLVVLAAAWGGSISPRLLAIDPIEASALVAVASALGLLETHRLNEHRFMANLGVSQTAIVAILAFPAIAAEFLIATLRIL